MPFAVTMLLCAAVQANTPPVASPDSYSVEEDTTLVVGAPGVLANDTDAEADMLTAVLLAAPGSGSVSLNADGSFSYAPDPGFVGVDAFMYKANDGTADSGAADVTIQVTRSSDRRRAGFCSAGAAAGAAGLGVALCAGLALASVAHGRRR